MSVATFSLACVGGPSGHRTSMIRSVGTRWPRSTARSLSSVRAFRLPRSPRSTRAVPRMTAKWPTRQSRTTLVSRLSCASRLSCDDIVSSGLAAVRSGLGHLQVALRKLFDVDVFEGDDLHGFHEPRRAIHVPHPGVRHAD